MGIKAPDSISVAVSTETAVKAIAVLALQGSSVEEAAEAALKGAIAQFLRRSGQTGWQLNKQYSCWEILGKHCRVTLKRRPAYCDRGDWLAIVDVYNPIALTVDSSDGFPRYYFGLEVAMTQMETWMKKRKEWIEGKKQQSMD